MARKVAIVARSATAGLAPFHDPKWEIWGLPWVIYPREPDLYFDLHSQECWSKEMMPAAERDEWQARISKSDVPVYCHADRAHLFKNPILFPFDDVCRLTDFAFFENTIAYQLGFALFSHCQEPIGEIGLYGINMMGTREYLWERASVMFWTGVLVGEGIKITVPEGSAFFMSYWMRGRYGETSEKRFNL